MKKLVEVQEVPDEGLMAFLGRPILLLCVNYFYTGKLIGVNDDCVLLENASIVYQTGEWSAKAYTDAQKLPTHTWYVQKSAIESFGAGNES